MRKRSSKGGGAQRSIQVHLMVNEEEAAMIRAAARKRNQTVSLTIIEAVKLLEGSLYVEEEEHDSPTVQALREIEYQLRRIGRNVNQIAHNANREMNATIEDEWKRNAPSCSSSMPKSHLAWASAVLSCCAMMISRRLSLSIPKHMRSPGRAMRIGSQSL